MPRGVLTEEQKARKLAALASPETRAKMRAAKLGRRQSPEHIAKVVSHHIGKPLSAEHRQKISESQKGKSFDPDHLANLRASRSRPEYRTALAKRQLGVPKSDSVKQKISEAKRGRALSPEHRDKISAGVVRSYLEGRRPYSSLESLAAALLEPLGFVRFPRYGGHAFDWGSPDGSAVVEVNGCWFHDHRAVKPDCRTVPKPGTFASDEAYRAIARASGLKLIELWACERDEWPSIIDIRAWPGERRSTSRERCPGGAGPDRRLTDREAGRS